MPRPAPGAGLPRPGAAGGTPTSPAGSEPAQSRSRSSRMAVPARIMQPHLSAAVGQPLVVENRTGAAGNVGMEAAARAAPDGYTLYLGNVGTLAVNPSVFSRTLKVRPTEDFAAVSL